MMNKKITVIMLISFLFLAAIIIIIVVDRHAPTTKKETTTTQTNSPEEILPNQIRINEIAEEAEATSQHYAVIQTKAQKILQLQNIWCDKQKPEIPGVKDACIPRVMRILSDDNNNEVEKSIVALTNRGVTIVIQSQPGIVAIESRPEINVGAIYRDDQGNIIIPTNSDYQDVREYLRLP